MKKVILGIVLVILVGLGIVGFMKQPEKITRQIKDEEYQEIMDVDYDYQYPESPTEVVKAYGRIDALIYSFKFEGKREGRLEELVSKQTQLLDSEFIAYNGGVEKVILSKMEGAKQLLAENKKVIDVKYQTSSDQTIDDNGNLVKFVNVIYYFNAFGGDNVYRSYALRKDANRHWKIFTYADVEPFVIK